VENIPTNTPQTSTPWYAESNGADRPVIEQAKEQTQQVLQQTQRKAGQMVDQVRTQVMSQLESQKERATGGLTSVAQALRQTGQHLREQDQAAISDYAERAAEAVEQFSGSMSRYSVGEIFGEIESFAHRQPALFLGSTFVLGFLATRFLKSSTPSAGGASPTSGLPSSGSRPLPAVAAEIVPPLGIPVGETDNPGPAVTKSPIARPANGA
jgi:hypothetical protein